VGDFGLRPTAPMWARFRSACRISATGIVVVLVCTSANSGPPLNPTNGDGPFFLGIGTIDPPRAFRSAIRSWAWSLLGAFGATAEARLPQIHVTFMKPLCRGGTASMLRCLWSDISRLRRTIERNVAAEKFRPPDGVTNGHAWWWFSTLERHDRAVAAKPATTRTPPNAGKEKPRQQKDQFAANTNTLGRRQEIEDRQIGELRKEYADDDQSVTTRY
jgi:hypothetical protein